QRVKDIFLKAVEQTGPPEREACLRQACGEDDALRHRVEVLLRRHDQANSILERPAFEPMAILAPQSAGTDDPAPQQEAAGIRLGPYSCCKRSARAGWGPSGWPISRSRSAAWLPSRSSGSKWSAAWWSPASR